MTGDPGNIEPVLGGWREVRDTITDLWHELWADPQPLPVFYLLCDGCANVTPRTSVQKSYSITEGGITGGTPESVCAACGHAQPRVVDDEVPADTTVTCTGHPHRRFGTKRRRRPCARTITVPDRATMIICPWCITEQPGPAAKR